MMLGVDLTVQGGVLVRNEVCMRQAALEGAYGAVEESISSDVSLEDWFSFDQDLGYVGVFVDIGVFLSKETFLGKNRLFESWNYSAIRQPDGRDCVVDESEASEISQLCTLDDASGGGYSDVALPKVCASFV